MPITLVDTAPVTWIDLDEKTYGPVADTARTEVDPPEPISVGGTVLQNNILAANTYSLTLAAILSIIALPNLRRKTTE